MIYDLYGKEGLSQGWDLVDLSGKTKEQVKRIFDEINSHQKKEDETKVDMTGKITVSLKSNEIFSKEILYGKKTIPEVADMTITQSAIIFENPKNVLKMGGTIGHYQKSGYGSLNFDYFHRFSNSFWTESKAVSTGEQTFLEIGFFKNLSPLVKAYVKGLLFNNVRNIGIAFGVEKQISPTKKMMFSWNFGSQPEVSIGLQNGMSNENSEITASRYDTSIIVKKKN